MNNKFIEKNFFIFGVVIITAAVIILSGGIILGKFQQYSNWKTYTHNGVEFSIKYPPLWKLNDMSNDSGSLKSILFIGKEGTVEISYGFGFGGACPQCYKKMKVGSEQFNVCDSIAGGVESWSMDEQFEDYGIGILATANNPYSSNRNTILEILSTFKFKK